MKINLVIPSVNATPEGRPRACPHCAKPILHRHGRLRKPIKDHKLGEIEAHRYKCASCRRTFRHYPSGVSRKDQSNRTVVLAALMYALGLSCSVASHLLEALGAKVSKITVWRDAQEAGEASRRSRPSGRVRVLGADETVFKVKGQEVVLGFVVDAVSGRTLGFEVLFEGDGRAFREWLKPYAKELDAEVLISDDNDSYALAATELGLSQQLCVAHVRKYVAKRSKSIYEQAEKEWDEQEEEEEEEEQGGGGGGGGKLKNLKEDLGRLKELVEELPEGGEKEIGRLHRGYLWASPPTRGRSKSEKEGLKKASAGYRMRMLTLELSEKWHKIRLHLARPELKLDGTNNASERAISKSKVRYKTMRGYKSTEGMSNGLALTQWLYSGEDEHDLAKEMAA